MPTAARFFSTYRQAFIHALCAVAWLSGTLALARPESARAFGFDDVAALAEKQARTPFRNTSRVAPAQLQALDYDQYRDIRFRPDHALWRSENLPFELMFFHLGGDWQKLSVR